MIFLLGATSALGAGCSFRGIRPSFDIAGTVPAAGESGDEFAAALFQTTGAHLEPGHAWQLDNNGEVFDAIAADIAEAKVSINFVEYIWEPGEASERLLGALAARSRGVRCRILVDPLGSPRFAKEVAPRLIAMGCEARIFRPLSRDNIFERNHRKLVVLDGAVAYVGGFGVREEWRSIRRRYFRRSRKRFMGEWRDENLRITGPVARDVQRAFAQNWQEAGGGLLPAAELPIVSAKGETRAAFVCSTAGYLSNAERLVHLLIKSARRRIYIANAYFVPGRSLLDALIDKAKAGVDVRLLVPGRNNDIALSELGQRNRYRELLESGVRIFEYQLAMMHSKTMVVDDRLAMIGSINLNLLSLNRLDEAAVVVEDPRLIAELDADWAEDVADSREVVRK